RCCDAPRAEPSPRHGRRRPGADGSRQRGGLLRAGGGRGAAVIFLGADTEQLRVHGELVRTGAGRVDELIRQVRGVAANTNPDPTELELFPTVTPGQDGDGEEDSDDDAGGGDSADDDTSGDGPADGGPSDGEATGKDSSHGDPADDDSAPGADTGDGADRTGATGDEATGHSGGLATTGTEAAPLALLVLALLGVGA